MWIGNCDYGLGLGTRDLDPGLRIGIMDFYWGLGVGDRGLGIGNWDWVFEIWIKDWD